MRACSRSDRRSTGGCIASWCAAVLVPLVSGCGSDRVAAPSADAGRAAELRSRLASASPAVAAADAVPVGTGWATLKGRFVFAGDTGTPRALVADKDTEVCSKDGVKLLDRSLLVDPSGKGLANVVVFVRKASRVKEETPSSTPVVFDQKNCEFLAPVVAARVGQPVDVKNSDPIGHNTNVSGSDFNQLIPAGGSTTYVPKAETGLPTMVTCNVHPWMKAYMVFRKDGYVAVSAADGSFVIADLPSGELLEFQVWHERSTGANGALGLDKPDLKWTPKGRFQITLEENEVKDLGTLDVPASAIGT